MLASRGSQMRRPTAGVRPQEARAMDERQLLCKSI